MEDRLNYEQIESSQRQHNEIMRYEEERVQAHGRQVLTTFKILEPKLFKDGDAWCCLLGSNIMEGICGFGKSRFLAMAEFHENLHKGE